MVHTEWRNVVAHGCVLAYCPMLIQYLKKKKKKLACKLGALKEVDEEGKSVQSGRGVFIQEREHER